jgi:hypothetical protein
MRWFLKAIETINSKGILATQPETQEDLHFKNIGEWKDFLPSVQPVVFMPTGITESIEHRYSDNSHELAETTLDAPFPIFSIEMLDGPITVGDICVWCIIAAEMEPKKFSVLNLCSDLGRKNFNVAMSQATTPIMDELLKRLNSQKQAVGTEITRSNAIKLNTDGVKQSFRIRKIVHVVPKKQTEEYETTANRQIDWSHRWWVRGHWRSIKMGLGKNRNGDYCIANYTWVSEHEKGPEEAPLISKTRLVKK